MSRAVTGGSPTPRTRSRQTALTWTYALTLDQLDARGRVLRHVPCRTAGLARQHPRPRTKIRTRCGPSRLSSSRFHPVSQVKGGGARVPPADEESSGVVLAEEAGLLLETRERAPDLCVCTSGALLRGLSRRGALCAATPGFSHHCPDPDQLFRTSHGPDPLFSRHLPLPDGCGSF